MQTFSPLLCSNQVEKRRPLMRKTFILLTAFMALGVSAMSAQHRGGGGTSHSSSGHSNISHSSYRGSGPAVSNRGAFVNRGAVANRGAFVNRGAVANRG